MTCPNVSLTDGYANTSAYLYRAEGPCENLTYKWTRFSIPSSLAYSLRPLCAGPSPTMVNVASGSTGVEVVKIRSSCPETFQLHGDMPQNFPGLEVRSVWSAQEADQRPNIDRSRDNVKRNVETHLLPVVDKTFALDN